MCWPGPVRERIEVGKRKTQVNDVAAVRGDVGDERLLARRLGERDARDADHEVARRPRLAGERVTLLRLLV
jgi:hypothetical protein